MSLHDEHLIKTYMGRSYCIKFKGASIEAYYLSWNSIDTKESILQYERIKFPKVATVPLSDKAWGIINKYKKQTYSNYVLPVFQEKHTTEKAERRRIKSLRQKLNATFVKVRTLIKCDEKITWYSARGTFIITMVNAGLGPMEVANMAGNFYMTIFNNYYKNTRGKELGGIVNNIFNNQQVDVSSFYAVKVSSNTQIENHVLTPAI